MSQSPTGLCVTPSFFPHLLQNPSKLRKESLSKIGWTKRKHQSNCIDRRSVVLIKDEIYILASKCVLN